MSKQLNDLRAYVAKLAQRVLDQEQQIERLKADVFKLEQRTAPDLAGSERDE